MTSSQHRPCGTACRASFRQGQRGIAAILLVLLLGMALAASVLGTVYYLRSTQQQSVSLHAQTQAQMKAWTGVEVVRQYLLQLQNDNKLAELAALPLPATLSLSGTGVTGTLSASLVAVDSTSAPTRLTFRINGNSAATTWAEANSQVEVVYATSGSSATPAICTVQPKSSTIFNGNLKITGGETAITNGTDYESLLITGNLDIGSASQATISGCVKGNITLSGGGIKSNASLYSEGDFTVSNMSPPVNATVWARNINIGNSGSGSYAALKAGAYVANVQDGAGSVIGTTQVGGKLIASTAGTTIPWASGTVMPVTAGSILIKLSDGTTTFLVDLSKASTDTAGLVTLATAASERLTGSGSLPSTLRFVANGIYGGGIDLYTLTVSQLWAHALNVQGYGGTYTTTYANGDAKIVTGTFKDFVGGGALWATQAGFAVYNAGYSYESASYSNFPTVTGSIAGKLYYGSAKTEVPSKYRSAVAPNLKTDQTGTSPGLPGLPYCDARIEAISADDYKSQANYVFEFVNGSPQVAVQNVKKSDGTSLDGTYTLQQMNKLGLMVCNWYDSGGQDATACTQGSSTAWSFTGIYKWPPGILWFDKAVTINGTSGNMDLINTIVGKGLVTLTTSGHGSLYAPNFSTVAKVCSGSTYPTNLCTKSSSGTMSFVTWQDSTGTTYTGWPLANMAILSEGGLSSGGWTIYGNVSIGGQLENSGNASLIYGTLKVGANQTSSSTSTFTQGGVKVDTSGLNNSQSQQPSQSCTTSTPASTEVKVLWSRYV